MMRSVLLYSLLALLACNGASSSGEVAASEGVVTDGYTLEAVPGTELVRASKRNGDGGMVEHGYLMNDQMQGTWMYYENLSKEFPSKIANYHRGVLHGPYFEITEQGAITLQANYENGQLHGPWGSYKFNRPLKTANYKHGVLDGVYKEYADLNGRLLKEVYYKDGKEDGPYRFYNDEGRVTVQYLYKNGEKVSGGIVEPEADAEVQ